MALREPVSLYQQRGNVRIVQPAVEPVTIAELKAHLAITDSGDDDILYDLLAEAREQIEQSSGLALISQQWRMTIDQWPAGSSQWWDGVREGHPSMLYGPRGAAWVKLPVYPLISVDSVTVFDEDSNSAAVTIANTFDIDTQQMPGRMGLKFGATWPIALRPTNAIQIVYTSGYGSTPASVPRTLRRAVRSLAAYLYAHRGDGCDPVEAMQKSGAQSAVGEYKVTRI
jgi:uncharacterized phiE125 gp8 family phage protein